MVARKVAEFVEAWKGKGDEKQDTQRFWRELLHMVLGVENPARHLLFEKKVKLEDSTRFIDGYIPEILFPVSGQHDSDGVSRDEKVGYRDTYKNRNIN